MKRVTIKDIANQLCLSVSTVSRALANDKNIRKETRDKVFETARKMGYVRNLVAAILRTGRSNTIGVVVDQMITPYASKVLQGINKEMRSKGIYVLTYDADNDPEVEREYLSMIENSVIDGLIVTQCIHPENLENLRYLHDKGIPMVFLQSKVKGIDAPMVGVNSYDKGFFLIDHLVLAGRRRIVNLKGTPLDSVTCDLGRAYCDVMKKFNLPIVPELQIEGGTDIESGRKIADQLLDSGIEFDGVFAVNELEAIGIMNRLMERGKRIPEDVAVAAFTGSQLSEMVHPTLTSVEAPLEDMGRLAARLLERKIHHPDCRQDVVLVDADIRLRESTHKKSD